MNVMLAVFLPLTLAYAKALWWCVEMWWLPEGYYSHGLLVAPLMAFLLWWRRPEWSQVQARPDPRGWLLLGPGLFLHLGGAALTIDSLSAASLLLSVPGAVWLAWGLERLRRIGSVLGLLLFAVPLPLFVTGRIAFQLKEVAVNAGVGLANVFGLGAVRDIALVRIPGQAEGLLVADACGGLRSLLAMLTIAWCIAFFTGPRGSVRRIVLLLASGPLALTVNALRIAGICWSARWFGTAFAGGTGHELWNVVAWIVDLALLLAIDALLRRRLRPVSVPATAMAAAAQPARLLVSSVILLCASLPLVVLSWYRPYGDSAGRAEAMPARIDGFELIERIPMPPRYRELLGTDDVSWRRYQNTAREPVWLVALFHGSNWKSVHPPMICIEGSNMDIVDAGTVPIGAPSGASEAGRILAHDRSSGRTYVSLFAYGARGFCTGSYWSFFRYHAPRALLRDSNAGFLLRVEAFADAGPDGTATAEARCRQMLEALLPAAEGLLK